MNKLIGSLLLAVLLLAGCKSRNEVDSANLQRREAQIIREYLADKNIQAELDPSGIYFRILAPSNTNVRPQAFDTVSVKYTGAVLYGKIFDTTKFTDTPARLVLNTTIPGWQVMLSQMQQGERRELYIPSTLAYGGSGQTDRNTGRLIIPPNSILVFEVELVSLSRRQ